MAGQDQNSLILVGRIFRPHGVDGEIKVIPETDDPERFSGLKEVFVGNNPSEAIPFYLDTARFQTSKHGITVVIKLSGLDNRDAADTLRKKGVYAREEDLPSLEEDEVFVHDLIGLKVFTVIGDSVGVVEDVLEMPAHLVYVVRRENANNVMIPDVSEIVVDIDLAGQQLIIKPIEGLLE